MLIYNQEVSTAPVWLKRWIVEKNSQVGPVGFGAVIWGAHLCCCKGTCLSPAFQRVFFLLKMGGIPDLPPQNCSPLIVHLIGKVGSHTVQCPEVFTSALPKANRWFYLQGFVTCKIHVENKECVRGLLIWVLPGVSIGAIIAWNKHTGKVILIQMVWGMPLFLECRSS